MTLLRQNAYRAWCLIFISALGLLGRSTSPLCAATSTYDQQYVPIEPSELKAKLLQDDHDALKMYDLIRRADTQDQTSVAFETLNQMRLKQPNNAVVLASFCFVARIAAGDYGKPGEKHRGLSSSEVVDYENALLKAYSVDPKLWLTYAVQGHNLSRGISEDEQCIFLLKKSIRLAPNISYTHTLLGEKYLLYDPGHMSYEKAIQELTIARHLQPVSSHNADLLFIMYDALTPNREKAKEAKQYLLSTLPTNFKFSPQFKARLAKY